MSRIENTTHAQITLEITFQSTLCTTSSADHAPLLPPPDVQGMTGCGGVAEALARLVLESAASQRKSARACEAAEERTQHAAEDAQVAEIRAKAKGMLTAAWVEGGLGVAGGALTVASLPGSNASRQNGLRQFGDQVSNSSKVASGIGGAAQAKREAEIEQQRAFAQRALRACDDGKRAAQDAIELAGKALAFVRDAARTQADCSLTAVRWG